MAVAGAAGGVSRTSPWLTSVADWLPRGGALDPHSFALRHRGISTLLWVHVFLLPSIAIVRGGAPLHSLADAIVIAALATVASLPQLTNLVRSAAATMGLLVSSAAVVHIFDGAIEAHFHFFVMVAVVALYQEWLPFLLALAFVVLHHGVVGTMMPTEVYNHPAAVADPWLWGLVHGGFVLAESVACLIHWRASEQALGRERHVRRAAEQTGQALAHAQELSQMGSWEWDVVAATVTWSDQLYALAGLDRTTFRPSVGTFLELVHPEERAEIAEVIDRSVRLGEPLDFECRVLRADGEPRIVHAMGGVTLGDDRRVLFMRGAIQDVTDRRRLQEAVTQLAFQDPLTGLANRRLFLDRLGEAIERCSAGEGSCAVLFIDLDGFKAVNDRYGHAAGDVLLQEVASRLRAAVRVTDTVSRFGGDEFALLCPGLDRAAAVGTARAIEIELRRPFPIGGVAVVIAASVGVSVAGAGATADAVLQQADAAMYEAKAKARSAPS